MAADRPLFAGRSVEQAPGDYGRGRVILQGSVPEDITDFKDRAREERAGESKIQMPGVQDNFEKRRSYDNWAL